MQDNADKRLNTEYAEEEYLQAVHNPSYRVHLHRIIAKHASEWYYGKDDPLWSTYLNTLTTDAPLWKTYTEAFIDKLTWMKKVDGMGPKVWHMHPVVFLEAFTSQQSDLITLEILLAANLGSDETQCQKVLPFINKYARIYGMEDKKEICHFLSQVGHESGFLITQENLNYSAKGMRRIFGCKKGRSHYVTSTDDCDLGRLRDKLWSQEATYAHNPEKLANYVYENRMGNGPEPSGEGYKYRGRGMIQLTGKDGCRNFNETHNNKNPNDVKDFIANPDLIITSIEYGVESAFSFWASKGLNNSAKNLNVKDVTQKVNGGQNGYTDRRDRYNNIAPLLNIDKD